MIEIGQVSWLGAS